MNCDINGPIIIKILDAISLSSLEELDIGNNSFGPDYFWEITRVLNIKHKRLSSLFIQGNQLEEEGAKKWENNFNLNKGESWNLKLSKFNISINSQGANFIGSSGLKSIKGLLFNNNNVGMLNEFYLGIVCLGANNLGDDGARILHYIIIFLTDLKVLYVSYI